MMRADFIAMLSHEIRTPLTSIRESVNMIAEEVMGPTNAQQRRFLTIASSEIGRIAELLNHLMQVSRLQSAEIKLRPRPICPIALIHTCIQLMKPAAEMGEIELESRLPAKLPKIMGDEKYFQQVVMNLLGNAIKFSPPHKPVQISAKNEAVHHRIKFSVQDFGPGIPQAEQSLIFNKYYRAQEVREHMDGTGLGLSISKFIVEAHDGEIWVDSAVGRGSTFIFTIPQAH
jgi:signal transduction histidine kinase